eukprot:EG_transcript_11504
MDAFIEQMLVSANAICPLAITPVLPHPVSHGALTLCIAGEERELPLMPLFAEFCRLDEGDRGKFLRHVFLQHIIRGEGDRLFGCEKAGSLAERRRQLMPLLACQEWITRKSQVLPRGVVVPFQALDGQDGTKEGFCICLVVDHNGFSLVLSSHLQAWGADVSGLMQIAMENLKARTPLQNCWAIHPSGCVISKWADGYDATRAILMPELVGVVARKLLSTASAIDSDSDSDFEGDIKGKRSHEPDMIVTVANQSQLIAAPANQPMALCFMGQMVLETFTLRNFNVITPSVFRLRSLTRPDSPSPTDPGSNSHPSFRWEPYSPGPGEYSVPRCAEECKAIMVGAHCGQVPVFHHAPEGTDDLPSSSTHDARDASKPARPAPPHPEADEAERERQQGNACFRRKRWEDALQHYSAAIRLAPDHRKLIPMANRAAVWLEMGRYVDAVADCNAVLSR